MLRAGTGCTTAAAVLLRAATFFASHGIVIRDVISDNAFAYRHSTDFKDAIDALVTPAAQALDPWLHHYNNERSHHGLGGKTPISRAQS